MRQTIDRSIELEHILELPNESGSEADGVDNHQFSYNYNMINRDFYQHTGSYIGNNINGLDLSNSSVSNQSFENSVESDNSDFFAFDK